jgi:hypothetical protein
MHRDQVDTMLLQICEFCALFCEIVVLFLVGVVTALYKANNAK